MHSADEHWADLLQLLLVVPFLEQDGPFIISCDAYVFIIYNNTFIDKRETCMEDILDAGIAS